MAALHRFRSWIRRHATWACALLLLFETGLFTSFAQTAVSTNESRSLALTFDDLPMAVVGNDHIAGDLKTSREISKNILKQLAAHHATAIGFVNEGKLNVPGERDARTALLEEWLQAGLVLGNHGYEHLSLGAVSLSTYEEDFVRGDTITAVLLKRHGLTESYFRHPYLDTGDTAEKKSGFKAFLTARNYHVAPVTVQNEDWMFNAPYTQAVAHRDKNAMERLTQAYLDHTRSQLEHAEKMSRDTFQRQIPLVMVLHANLLNAKNLGAVLGLMEQRGYNFVSLESALQDPAYRTADNYVGSDGVSWLDRWQLALGRPMHPTEPEPPKWVQEQYDEITSPKRP